MRFELTRNLIGNEVLGKVVTDSQGNVLVTPGTQLTANIISKLMKYGIFSLYILDENLPEIQQDEKAAVLKQAALQNLPEVFKNITSGHSMEIYKSYNSIKELINYIIDDGDIRTNLFEINMYDNYTYIHCIDTGIMATFLGLSMKLPKEELRLLGEGAVLHDIGKILIPEEIINKKSRLTDEEFNIIKRHPIYGYRLAKDAGITDDIILDVISHHHEKIDGKGYPDGLRGNDISTYSKIVTICDVFTALSSNRSYRERFNPNDAYEYILSNSGIIFDSDIVQTFRKVFSIYPLGCCVKLSNGTEGFVVKQNSNFPDRPVLRITYDFESKKKISAYEINLLDYPNLVIVAVVQK